MFRLDVAKLILVGFRARMDGQTRPIHCFFSYIENIL